MLLANVLWKAPVVLLHVLYRLQGNLTYQGFISVLDVKCLFGIKIGLLDLSGDVISTVTASDTAIVVLLAKSMATRR